MIKYVITAEITIDETHPHALDLTDCRLAVENALEPETERADYGIQEIVVTGREE